MKLEHVKLLFAIVMGVFSQVGTIMWASQFPIIVRQSIAPIVFLQVLVVYWMTWFMYMALDNQKKEKTK